MVVFNARGKEPAERELEIHARKGVLVGRHEEGAVAESVFLGGGGGSFLHGDRTERERAGVGKCSICGSKVGTSHRKTFVFPEVRGEVI